MKHIYRFFSLAALLLLPLMPVRAGFDDGTANGEDIGGINTESGDTVASGQLTTTLDWVLLSNGTLELIGTGAMPDFDYPDYGPWYSYRSQISQLDLPQGLTSIGRYAFYFCDHLSTVQIPEGVTLVDYCAFSGCEILSYISFPSTLETIGSAIVADAHMLTELIIPASVTSIGSRLTDGCQLITSLVVEGDNAVYSSFGGSNVVVRLSDNYLVAGCQTSIIPSVVERIGTQAFSSQRKMTSITIPASVTTIDDSAFEYCSALESLTCEAETPPTLGGNYVFQQVDTSIPVYVPSGSVSAYQTASRWSNFTNIKAIGSDSGTGTDSTQTTDTLLVDGLYYHIIATQSNAVEVIRNPTASSNGYSGDIVIPETISVAGAVYDVVGIAYNAFTSCYNMTSIYIPASVTSIEDGSFLSTTALASITIENGNSSYDSRDNCNAIIETGTNTLIVGCRNTVIPSSVYTIGNSAFNFCSAMDAIEIPNSVTMIGDYAFYWCESLSTITIPSSVTSIGSDAFDNCTGLTSFTCEAETPPTLGTDVFIGIPNTIPLYVPENSVSMYQLDQGWSYFTNIKAIGDTTSTEPSGCYTDYGDLTTTLSWVLTCDNVLQIIGTGDMPDYSSSTIPWKSYKSDITSIEISEGVTRIGDWAFYGLSNVTNLVIPEGVISLGYVAAATMRGLKTISLPSTLNTIESGAISANDVLESLYIPASVTSIGTRLTEGCHALASLTVDEANPVYNSGNGANAVIVTATNTLFAGCKNTVIPETVVTIGESAFAMNYGLTSITIPESVTSIEKYAFQYSKLTEVYCLAESPARLGQSAFLNVTSTATLYVPDYSVSTYQEAEGWSEFSSIKALPISGTCGENLTWSFTSSDSTLTITGTGAMYDYGVETVSPDGGPSNGGQMAPWFEQEVSQSVYHVVLPEGMTTIGSYAFYYMSNLMSAAIPSTVTSIGEHAFAQCGEMTECTVAESGITSIGAYAFNECMRLTSFEIPSTVTTIGEGAFQSCTNLHYAIVPAGVTTIQPNTFYSCQMLSTVYLYDGLETIGNFAFNACKRLTKITLPSTVTSIGDNAFEYCEALTSVDLSDNLTTIGGLAFYGCPFSSIELPASLTTIGYGAFMSCANITSVTSLATTPPTIQSEATGATADAFPDASDVLEIFVPYTSVEAYQRATGWSRYNIQAIACDEIFESTEAAEMCYGDFFVWHDKELTEAGEYQDTLQTAAGCDSIVTLNLTYAPSYDFIDSMYVCEKDLPFIWHDREFMIAGDYYDSLETAFGCDSVYKLHLEIAPAYYFSDIIYGCENSLYKWHGRYLELDGIYYDSLTTIYGCDSIYRLDYRRHPMYMVYDSATICEGQSYEWNDSVYTEAGRHFKALQTIYGCDSFCYLDLTVLRPSVSYDTATICYGDTYMWNGREYTAQGDYNMTLESVSGCDSIANLHLEVMPIYFYPDTVYLCENAPYEWHGQSIKATGTYYDSLQSVYGCDSIYQLVATVNPTFFHTTSQTVCEGTAYGWHDREFTESGVYYDSLTTSAGCDSVYELILTIDTKEMVDDSVTVCEGKPVEWRGKNYYEAGAYRDTVRHIVSGCDSIVYTLHLTVNPNKTAEENAVLCQGETFTWNDNTYTETGDYTVTLSTAEGCDSTVTLHLTVYPTYSFEETKSVCESALPFNWHDRDYYQAGIYYDTLHTIHGCDSVFRLTLTIRQTYASYDTAAICYGESYTWNGRPYAAQGDYEMTFEAQNGCDSVAHLHLTENPIYFYSDTIILCDNMPYDWHGQSIKTTGYYYDSLQSVFGCDSIYQLVATVNPTYATEATANMCQGESYIWYGVEYTESGDYPTTLTSITGCDSVVTLHLTVNPEYTNDTMATICSSGIPFIWHGHEYVESGIYKDTLTTIAGCDSIIRLNLTVYPSYEVHDTVTICYGESYTWNGQQYSAQGDYEMTFEAQGGCDSVAHLHLTENPIYFYSDTIILCDNMPYDWHGQSIKATGYYYDSLQSVFGCDSIYQLVATVNPTYATEATANMCQGESYMWYGVEYTESGDYPTTLTSITGCDSIVTLHLTVHPTSLIEENGAICEGGTYAWHRRVLTEAGIYYDTLQTIHGCDSVFRLNLTVYPSFFFEDTMSICRGEEATWHGHTFTDLMQGEYTYYDSLDTEYGCDSIYRLTLTVNPTFMTGNTVTICQGDSYVWRDRILTEAGEYYDSLTTIYGCDSIFRLTLLVNPSYQFEEEASTCQGTAYTWHGRDLTTAGIYSDTLQTIHGCDSIFRLTLTVYPSYQFEEEASTCQGTAYTWHGRDLYQSGIYFDTVQSIYGCDSVVTLHLTVNRTYVFDDTAYTCQGTAYTWHGKDYYQAGFYYDSLQTIYGCDSICRLSLYVMNLDVYSEEAAICEGESYTWHGHIYTTAGIYYDTIRYVETGCDSSISTLTLRVNPTYLNDEMATTCYVPYTWHGRDLYQSGIYYDTLQSIYGCDSIIRLMLTVHETYAVTEEAAICEGETYTWHNRTLTKKGTYRDTLQSLQGCDSICTLVLTVNPKYLIEDIVSIREDKLPYRWQGENITQAGDYRKEFISVNGCDSVHTLHLVVTALPIYTVNVIADHGRVNGTGTYAEGTLIHLEAVPDEGFEFQMWSDGSDINPKSFVVTQDTTLRAHFFMPEVEQEVVVDSIETTSVTIVWDTVPGATLYELRIYKNGELVVTYEVDPDNNIVGEHHIGPDRLVARKDSTGGTSETLQVSVGGLAPGQDYTYSLDALDDDRSYVGAQSGSFTTEEDETDLRDTLFDDRRPEPRKVFRDGQLYIEMPDGTRYSPEGHLMLVDN